MFYMLIMRISKSSKDFVNHFAGFSECYVNVQIKKYQIKNRQTDGKTGTYIHHVIFLKAVYVGITIFVTGIPVR